MQEALKRINQLTRDVDGRIVREEAELLYHLAGEGEGEGEIVEIGSFQGYSTIWLASGSKDKNREKVYAVDPHNTDLHGRNEAIFRENLRMTGLDDYVVPIVKTSVEAAVNWDTPIRLLWIDGAHDFENVKNDFLLWEKHLIDGGIVAFHDSYCIFWPDVGKVVNEYIFRSEKYSVIGCVNTIIFARKVKKLNQAEKTKNQDMKRSLHARDKAVDYFQVVESMIKERKYHEADRLLRNCERNINDFISPEYRLLTLNSIGNCHREIGNYARAGEIYQEILDYTNGDSNLVHKRYRTLIGMGDLYRAQGRYKDSADKYGEALESDGMPMGQRYHALMGLGRCRSTVGNYRDAETIYEEALSIENISAESRVNAVLEIGVCYSKQEKKDEELKTYLQVLSSGGFSNISKYRLLSRLGNIYLNRGCLEDAESRYIEALSLNDVPEKDRYHTLLGLGKCYRIKREHGKAEEKLEEAFSCADISDEFKLNAANELLDCCFNQGKFQTVEEICGKVLTLNGITDQQKRGLIARVREKIDSFKAQNGGTNV